MHQNSPHGDSDKSVFLRSSMKAFTQTQGVQTKIPIAQCYLIVPQPTLALAKWSAVTTLIKQLLTC